MSNNLKSFQIDSEGKLNELLALKELTFYQEIKNIPNQVLGLSLIEQDKYRHLAEENPYNEVIGYQVRYKFETGVTGTWRFQKRYGIKLKKNLTSNYGKNEILYIKEPFTVDTNDKTHYKFNSTEDNVKFTHQRYMKQEQSRCFVQIVDVQITKIENYHLDNVVFQEHKDRKNTLSFIKIKSDEETRQEPKKLEQKLFSHKYQVKYTCRLIENPLHTKIVSNQKTRYFYRLQMPNLNSDNNYISWDDFEMGYIEATSKKDARALLEDEFSTKITMRATKLDDMGVKYQYLLKVFPPDEYWDEFWSGEKECEICGAKFTIIDRNNKGDFKGSDSYCCSECNSIGKHNLNMLREEEKIYKTMEDNNGIHNPCIYKITNKNTQMVYIGQTTQYATFRWYQHFASPKSGSKFHSEICNGQITDWIFEVIEMFTNDDLKDIEYNQKNIYINQREQYWINHYNSIEDGYNSATADKQERDNFVRHQNGLINMETGEFKELSEFSQ